MPVESFCGSEFWNINVTWNTDDPDFTICFQKTFLIWMPCAFLWMFSFLEIFYIKNSFTRNIPYGFLNVSKLLLTSCLILLSIVDLVVAIIDNQNSDAYPVDYYSPAIKIVTFALSATLLYYNRRFGLQASGLQFLFWLVLLVCGIPQLRTQIRWRHEHAAGNDIHYNEYSFVSYFIFYIITLAVFILNCYADKEPLESMYPKSENPYPEIGASFLSRIFYMWFNSMAWKGYHQTLKHDDMWDMNPADSSKTIIPLFHKHWDRLVAKAKERNMKFPKSKKQQASILPALWHSFGPTFLFGTLLKLARDILAFASPMILKWLIDFVSNANAASNTTNDGKTREPFWHGIFYAVLLFIVASTQTLLLAQYFQRVGLVGLRIRTVLTGAIYQKSLRLSNSARKESTVGEIVNLMTIDAQRFMALAVTINTLWSAPIQIALAFYFLWGLLGPSMLAGLAFMILLIPINWVIAKRSESLQICQMKSKDERIKLMNEILNGMKVLKLYAWEPSFEDQVLKIREKELDVLKKAAYLNAGPQFIGTCTPFLVCLVSFACYVLVDENNVLDVETAFVALSLFILLRLPLVWLPTLLPDLIQAKVSLARMNKFMNSDELDHNTVSHDPNDETPLSMENGTFSWGDGGTILKNINLKVERSSLVAIVGTVGAGKSSIISAFLGEMNKVSGRVNTVGNVAYVAQQAWIQNATLQENILFGKPMDRKRYDQIIDACALKPDIDVLPGGDATEIGEKGINLSGGQKQRVSLARAVYNDADVYFFDDPLSAVDSHVGKHIFKHVIGPSGILANKTRLLVTHGITYLPNVDNVYVVKDGEISESGSMQELMNKKGAFAEFLLQHLQEADEEIEDLDELKHQLESNLGTNSDIGLIRTLERAISIRSELNSETASLNESLNYVSAESSVSSDDGLRKRSLSKQESQSEIQLAEKKNDRAQLIEQEKLEEGSVKRGVYKHYFKNVRWWLIILIISLSIVYQSFSIGSGFWLSRWANDQHVGNDESLRNMYLGVYAALGIGIGIAAIIMDLVPRTLAIVIARRLHSELLNGITHSPLSFYERTPIGRILTRFSRDIDIVDKYFPTIIINALFNTFELLGTIFIISVTTYMFLIALIPIGVIYYFVQRFYVPTSRQLLRLETASLSPIHSHISESIQGASTIRAYNLSNRFIDDTATKTDVNQKCYVPAFISNRWLAVRLEMIGNLIILFAALFAVLGRDAISAGMVGLSLSYALHITQTLTFLIRMICDIETHIVSVERIKEYTENKQEAAWNNSNVVVPQNWPEFGQVQFKNFELRYREGLDLVLKNVSFNVNGSEKIGIVGRTGAGKSSLTIALFRIIESAGGSIVIDGEDISKLGLHTLRGKLTIIPQDPVLFSGSLRINLDPLSEKSDDDIWRALELAHLKTFVKGLTAGLNHEVSEGGENLSVGQRQLICLARALLRKTKVLILDEATAAIDLETDEIIQKTIRSEFADCTVLTIAHRLNTIMDSDKVLVLDHGRISEFDSPTTLLQNKESAFYSMAKDAGLV